MDYAAIGKLVESVQQTDYEHLKNRDRSSRQVTNPWMPYQPADFVAILWECMPELAGKQFLDVGCGPGTKMAIARDLFGLEVHGIEIDPGLVTAAKDYLGEGAVVAKGNAMSFAQGYSGMDLIWLYRPFDDRALEHRLETIIMARMRPGAILAGSSWEHDPGALGWNPIVDDCLFSPDGTAKIVRGAWQKLATEEP